MMVKPRTASIVLVYTLVLGFTFGCGESSSPTSPTALPQQSLLSFTSSPGDWIGGGRSYRFTAADAKFTQQVAYNYPTSIVITVQSNDRQSYWNLYMGAPAGQELRAGTYENAERWLPLVLNRPRFTLEGDGRGCIETESRFEIRTLTYQGTYTNTSGPTVPLIDRLHVFFTHRCTETSAPGLTGEMSFVATP
jgi:hypothetical protein